MKKLTSKLDNDTRRHKIQCPPPLTSADATLLEGRKIFKKQTQNCIFFNKMHIFLSEKKTLGHTLAQTLKKLNLFQNKHFVPAFFSNFIW